MLGNPNIPLNAAFVDAFMDGDETDVTSRSSLNIPGFYRGIRIRSGIPASVQWNVMEKTPDGMQPATNSPAQRVLKYPNDAMTSFVFREILQTYTDIFGNGFAEIIRNGRGEPVELWPLHPNDVAVNIDGRKMANTFRENGRGRIILPSEMIHVKNYSLDGFYGLGLIDVSKKVLGYNMEGQQQASKYI
jgi:HK97 family phage portal protein